jgi:hypothetical protein
LWGSGPSFKQASNSDWLVVTSPSLARAPYEPSLARAPVAHERAVRRGPDPV